MASFDSVASYNFPIISHDTVYCFLIRWNFLSVGWEKPLLPFVTNKEIDIANHFINDADAARHLVGRAVARRAVCSALGNNFAREFCYTDLGKPFVSDGNIHFSISHSGQIVCVALCSCASVGIDVEKMRPLSDIINLFTMLHPKERLFLARKSRQEQLRGFFRCWTRKEAVLKAFGQGLAFPLDGFQVYAGEKKSDWICFIPKKMRDIGYFDSGKMEKNLCGRESCRQKMNNFTSYDIPVGSNYQCSLFGCAAGLNLKVFEL